MQNNLHYAFLYLITTKSNIIFFNYDISKHYFIFTFITSHENYLIFFYSAVTI